ncbi:RNA polymerase, sigma 54 subunit, RpoN [Candidatus Zixiibacteriota bacterium]|nr:RNA polymerase, sigma 54 subunit, RpoN [candidate division Zixibacteria bacterium]
MKLGLQLKLKQTLAPQLIQSLKMLQMPILKLEQTLRHELSVNPMLEELEPVETPETSERDDDSSLPQEDNQIDPKLDKIDWENYLGDDQEFKYRSNFNKEEEETFERVPVMEKSLYDHLLEQLSFMKLSEDEHLIGEYIIGNISPKGYLVCSNQEMADELKLPLEKVDKVLKIIQSFDPPGVGAHDLRESLMIQLEEKGYKDSLAYQIVDQYINVLDRKSILQISRAMGVPFEKAQQAMDLIKTLSPTPAYGRFESSAIPIVPDLIVDRLGEEYIVYHNDKNFPKLRINPGYRQLLKPGSKITKDTRKYVREKLEQARWLLNSINQRRTTMIRVMDAIVDEQKDFFEKGPAFLKPLIMEDIAQKVSMNVATISRVSNGKYVQTPQGVYEIKYFFNSGIASEEGEDISKRHVKNRIEEIIRAEDAEHPLSDQEIFQKLQDEKIMLARRTVTKYREELKIPPARFRKRMV